jgi:hypothetical protein
MTPRADGTAASTTVSCCTVFVADAFVKHWDLAAQRQPPWDIGLAGRPHHMLVALLGEWRSLLGEWR